MKIRTQLIIGIIVFALLLGIISALVIATNQQVDKLTNQEATANSIVLDASDLGYLSNNYILYREPVQVDRWNTKFASTSDDIASLSVDQPAQRAIANDLATNLQNTKSVFDDIALKSPPSGTTTSFVQLSWDRMAVQNQGMIFDANRLAGLIQTEVDGLKQARTILIFVLMGAFGALLLTGYFLFYRRTLNSIAELQEGAKIIGTGNLDHQIEVRTDDEISDLSRSFNRMTSELKSVIATKIDLEREIAGREQAEMDLRQSEEKYRNLFMNMTEEVHFWQLVRQPGGQIITWRLVDANPPTLKTWGKTRDEILGKTTDEIFGPGATDHYMPVVQKIMTEGVPYRFEDFFPNLDKYFLFTSVPFGDYFITTGADITGIKKAEDELRQERDNLNALNEELTATQEELHQNVDELSRREKDLTAALAEKDVLLSEIHHRVKNNLTAFISLLSLEGSIDDSPAGKTLKQDLENRARSMALVHETLYRTNMYDEVDMEMYLTNLLDQVGNSFQTTRSVKTVVDAHGVMLDIPRATPAGLIINELVTNSFKYAFPESFDAQAVRKAPPTITIGLAKIDNTYVMTVRDNGVGLPIGLDMMKTQTLGLKLVNFLARHQMRANVEVNSTAGTEFVFRFGEATRK